MRHWKLVATVLSLVLFPRLSALAQGTDGQTSIGANAAVKYWQAFAFLPPLDKAQEKLLTNWNKVPLDAAALKLIDRSQKSRDYLHRAASLEHCDWSLDYQDGMQLLVPHASNSLTLARLTALHARHEFDQGRWRAGWEDVGAVMKMARHIEMEPLMILQLVGYRIESMALEAAAPYLPELKLIMEETGTSFLDRPQVVPTLEQMVAMDKQLEALWMIRRLREAEQRQTGSWKNVWNEVFSSTKGSERYLGMPATTCENTVKILEDDLPLFDELARIAALPCKEFDAAYPVFVTKVKKAGPFAGLLLPNLNNIVPAQRRSQAQLAMFKTAIAVVEGGPGTLQGNNDPFGDGPFAYRATERGFELKSKLVVHGQPVTLMVGNAKKE